MDVCKAIIGCLSHLEAAIHAKLTDMRLVDSAFESHGRQRFSALTQQISLVTLVPYKI